MEQEDKMRLTVGRAWHSLPFAFPRGLKRIDAAAYISVSPNTFDRLVAEQRMPKPKRVGTRCIWDRVEIDSAFDAIDEPIENRDNDWDVVADG